MSFLLYVVVVFFFFILKILDCLDRFEERFGAGRTIPAANSTRWNSIYHQLNSLSKIGGVDARSLADLCDSQEFANIAISRQEWAQLLELLKILEPFAEATNLTQGKYFIYFKIKAYSLRHARQIPPIFFG